MRRGACRVRVYRSLGTSRVSEIARDLREFSDGLVSEGHALQAFAAIFPDDPPSDEIEFERRLWTELQALHDAEEPDTGWDRTVSDDPDDPRFSFSFAGRAFFIVGMHPASSRLSRRFAAPALVFNPHEQFERLRADGRFAPLQAAVRERDIALQGSLNPNLANHGERSEARQYSGRETGPAWTCPFHRK